MVKRMKSAVIIFTIKQLEKLLTVLYNNERLKDKETINIIRHLQNTLYQYTGKWWVS